MSAIAQKKKGDSMKATAEKLIITLERDEIETLNDVVLFALDLHAERIKKGKSCMYERELKLSRELVEITDKLK